MDRVTPLITAFGCYAGICAGLYRVIEAPEGLTALSKPREYRDFYGQHVSFVHAWLAVLLSFCVYTFEGGVDYEALSNQHHIIVIANSLGYLLYDTCYAEYYKVHDTPMRLHHVFSLFGGFTLYFSAYGGSVAMVFILLGEISNPWIMKRNIMRTKGQQHYLMYSVYEYTFAVTFIVLRSIGAALIAYNVWLTPINIVAKLNLSALYGVGLFWCLVILNMLYSKLRSDKEQPGLGLWLLGCLVYPLKHHLMLVVVVLVVISTVIPIVLTQVYHFGYINIRAGDTILL